MAYFYFYHIWFTIFKYYFSNALCLALYALKNNVYVPTKKTYKKHIKTYK